MRRFGELGTEEPPALNRYYNGIIDDFALFNRGLSQDEIKEIQGGIQEFWQLIPTQNCQRHGDTSNRDMRGSKSN